MNTPSDSNRPTRPAREDFTSKKENSHQHRHFLAFPSHRPRYDAAYLEKRSLFLRRAKWILPLVAFIFFINLIIYPEVTSFINASKTNVKNLSIAKIGDGHLIGITYRGVNAYHCPFTLTADTLYQDQHRNILTLTTPQADMLTSSGAWLFAHAPRGTYAQGSQILDLTHGVTLYRNDGLMLYSPFADINLKSGIIASHAWVRAEGPFGTLDAQGYFLSQHDGLAQFRGPGKLVFYGNNKTLH
ncbi:MAG: LPS export ABC transporter periplasmic protein LptC [Acetobacter sp.]|nr:LPS export ABC transporter periplasmic protein LptC [Acetobacter sp.]